TNWLSTSWQGCRLSALARKADVPFARAAALNSCRLGRAFHWAMQHHLHLPNVHHAQALGLRIQLAANRHLGKGEAGVASLAAKTGIAWFFFAVSHAPKERPDCQVNAHRDILQDLRLHARQRGTLRLEGGQARMLVIQEYRLLPLLPRI